jgi:hypothetical protein
MYGQPRGIDKTTVWESHKEFILDKYDTDVFCHMWYSPSVSNFQVSTHAGNKNTNIIVNSDLIIKDRYRPKDFIVDAPKTFDISYLKNKIEESGKYKCSENFSNYISQLYSIETAAKLCRSSSTYYDYIIIARYDIVITKFPDLEFLNDKFYCMNNHPRFPDLFFIFNSKFIDTQMVYSGLEYRILNNLDNGIIWEPSPECMKYLKYIEVASKDSIQPIDIKEYRI